VRGLAGRASASIRARGVTPQPCPQGPCHVPQQLLSLLPHLATIVVLTIVSAGPWKGWLNALACLGKPFHPTV
jgi:ABC-type uncharacterized transport system permease subunit